MSLKVTNVLLSILLLLMWCVILSVSFILLIVSDIIHHFGNGILKYIFSLIYILAFVLPIIFRKKLRRSFSLPLVLVVTTIISVMINSFMYIGINSYISDFSREKWDRNEKLRIHMIKDLENEYHIIGRNEKEIEELLGRPTNIPDYGEYRYEYYIGDSIIDPYTYDVIFDAGIVKETRIIEH